MISAEEIKSSSDFFSSGQRDRFLSHEFSDFSPETLFSYAKSSLLIFVQENVTGPPLNLPRWQQEGLELEGEDPVSYLFGGEYLKAASSVFLHSFHLIENEFESYLWRGRYAYIHQQALNHPVSLLFTIIQESYSKSELSALTHIEYSRCLIYYSQYEACESQLMLAEKCTGIKYSLTGKMGIRTKFQLKKNAQLVLSVVSQNPTAEDVKVPNSYPLDADCPLHETPQLDSEDLNEISIPDSALLLAWVNFFFKSLPPEDLNTEVISSYLDRILSKSIDWLIFSTALFYRSKNQFSRFKFKERSALQINTLVDQYKDPEPANRIQYAFALEYPMRHWLKVELAEMFLKLGAVHSAFQEFETVQMWEEAVECLIMGGKPNLAVDLAKTQLAVKRTPRMLCALADVTGEVELYEEAWEISAHRCTRAQRTLGKREFDKGNYLAATVHYEKSLEINPLYPNALFTLGCTYMKLENYQKACSAFQRLICIDSNLSEGWNNLAACNSKLGNFTEAYNALVQGIKHDRQNWRMTENLLILSLQIAKFFTAVECVQMLVNAGQCKLVDKDLFKVLNSLCEGKEQRLLELYRMIVNKVTVDCGVWKKYADFMEFQLMDKEKVLELRLKACRSAMIRENSQKNAVELEEIAIDLSRAYQMCDDDKVKYQGKLYLRSVAKKIQEALGRQANFEGFE